LDEKLQEFRDQVVHINRVTKVVKGGKNLNFSALVVIGNGHGKVGYGKGKAKEVPLAIEKATKDARKHVIVVPLKGSTIPHEITGKYGGGLVFLRPAAPGTGVIAGGPVRAVVELAGIQDILSKSLRSSNPYNVVKATFDGLSRLKSPEKVAMIRGKEFIK